MKYELIAAHDLHQFNELVNQRLQEGWNLYGFPYGVDDGDDDYSFPFHCQAMTKED